MLSHIIPVLFTSCLVTLAVYYALETDYIIRDMTETIQQQAEIVERYARENPDVTSSKDAAKEFIVQIRPDITTGIVVFDPNWNVLSFSNQISSDLNDLKYSIDLTPGTLLGPLLNVSMYNPFRKTDDIIEMLIPVLGDDSKILGIIRLNFPVSRFKETLTATTKRIWFILALGVLLGCVMGLILAKRVKNQIMRTTQAIYALSNGQRRDLLPETAEITELRQLSTAFNTLTSKLNKSEQERAKLTSHLTHELGRPLGALASAADALQRGAWKDETLARELTTGMKTEIKRLEKLVGDLSLLRDENDPELKYSFQDIDYLQWIKNIYIYWSEFARSKKITLMDEFSNSLPHVKIDEFRFAQAIGNLLSNAIKYTPEGGTVTLRSFVSDKSLITQVIDTGAGIPDEDLPHIFEAFYRGPSKKRITQGMGLGLSITQEVVAAHKGTISVKSECGKGSTFTITLPIN